MGKVELLTDKENPLGIAPSQLVNRSASVAPACAASNQGGGFKIEHFSNDEAKEFRISSKKEILAILKSIADQGTRVALHFELGSKQNFVMTSLLGANEHGMWLDIDPFFPENMQLLLSYKITFVSMNQQVKIQFAADDIKNALFKNNKAFYLALPDYLLRIQRREFFRSAIPSTPPIKCIIPIPSENPDDRVLMRELPLVDISGGGVRLQCEGHDATLLPDKKFRNCQIALPDVGILTVTIEVRSSIHFTTLKNVIYRRVGCRFIHLNNQMDILLQRHITRLQNESMAKQRLAGM